MLLSREHSVNAIDQGGIQVANYTGDSAHSNHSYPDETLARNAPHALSPSQSKFPNGFTRLGQLF